MLHKPMRLWKGCRAFTSLIQSTAQRYRCWSPGTFDTAKANNEVNLVKLSSGRTVFTPSLHHSSFWLSELAIGPAAPFDLLLYWIFVHPGSM